MSPSWTLDSVDTYHDPESLPVLGPRYTDLHTRTREGEERSEREVEEAINEKEKGERGNERGSIF